MFCFFDVTSGLTFIAALLLSSQGSPLSPKDCIVDKSGQTRIFSSLAEYQSTRDSFDVNQQGYRGNNVVFSFKTIDRLEKNSFISFGSESIIELSLDHKNINTLDVGAFLGLFCLETLNLSYNNISNISEGVFEGLPNLIKLDLSNNVLQTIPDNGLALYALKGIKILDLSNNQIRTLPRICFTPLAYLEILNLSFNKIKYLEASIFNGLTSLKTLLLNNNYLSTITPEDWEDLDNLGTLDLSKNYLTSFDMSYNFSFNNLRTLNLSGNFLTTINSLAMRKSLQKLNVLDISNNRWFCGDLPLLRHFLADTSVVIKDSGCVEARETFIPPLVFEEETTTTRSTTEANCAKKEETNLKISAQFEQLLAATTRLEKGSSRIESIVLYFFLFAVLILVLDIIIRVGGCRSVNRRCSSEERDYLDSGNIENLSLIRR